MMVKDRASMKLFTFLLAILILTAGSPVLSGNFSYGAELDKERSHWAEEYIVYCFEKGYFDGAPEDFAPDESISRAELVSCLAKVSERYEQQACKKGTEDLCADTENEVLFSDITGDEDYADAVEWAVNAGIINGIDGKFCPEQSADRQTVAVILHRFMNYLRADVKSDWSVLLDYADIDDISQWAVEGIAYCEFSGLMTGNEKGMFLPGKMLTKAEAAAIIKRLDTYIGQLKI